MITGENTRGLPKRAPPTTTVVTSGYVVVGGTSTSRREFGKIPRPFPHPSNLSYITRRRKGALQCPTTQLDMTGAWDKRKMFAIVRYITSCNGLCLLYCYVQTVWLAVDIEVGK